MPTLKYNRVEWEKFCSIWDGHANGFEKYFNLEPLVEYYQPVFKTLKIPDMSIPENVAYGRELKILDISTGFGVFPAMCVQMGHHARITDIVNNYSKVCLEAQKLLGLSPCINYDFHTDKGSFGNLFPSNPENKNEKRFGYRPIPKEFDGHKFDIITGFASSPMSYFDDIDWYMFLHDCKAHLESRGVVCLLPNRSRGYDSLKGICENMTTYVKPCLHGFIIGKEDVL